MVVERKTHIPEDIDDDCISRKAVLALATELSFDGIKGLEHWKCNHIDPLKVMELPPIPPKKVCIAEVKVERDEVEQLIAEKVEEIKRAICSREKEQTTMTLEQKIAELENIRDSYDDVREHCALWSSGCCGNKVACVNHFKNGCIGDKKEVEQLIAWLNDYRMRLRKEIEYMRKSYKRG